MSETKIKKATDYEKFERSDIGADKKMIVAIKKLAEQIEHDLNSVAPALGLEKVSCKIRNDSANSYSFINEGQIFMELDVFKKEGGTLVEIDIISKHLESDRYIKLNTYINSKKDKIKLYTLAFFSSVMLKTDNVTVEIVKK